MKTKGQSGRGDPTIYRFLVTGAACFGLGIGFANMPFLYSSGPHTHEVVACADLDNYVEQTKGISDFQYHFSEFGIHRQRTIDAVNELYERAHCGPTPTKIPGRMVYEKIETDVVADQMPDAEGNLAPRSVPVKAVAEPPRSYPLYCESAWHLTPNKLPTVTPVEDVQVIAIARRLPDWVGSALGADVGSS